MRGDSTRVYFFDVDELRRISLERLGRRRNTKRRIAMHGWGVPPLQLGLAGSRSMTWKLGVDRRLLVNRKTQVKMYRCWMQAVFEKV